jgi:hypothetical protein
LERKLEQKEQEEKQLALDVLKDEREPSHRGVSTTTFRQRLKEQKEEKEVNYLDYWMFKEQDRDSVHDIGRGLTESINFPYDANIKYVPEVIKPVSKPKFDKTMTDYSSDMFKSFSDFFNKESPQSIFNGFQETASKLNEEFSNLSANSNSICNTVIDKFFKEELLTDDDIISMIPKKVDKFLKSPLGTTVPYIPEQLEKQPNYDLLRKDIKKKIKDDFCISFEPSVQFDYKSIQGVDNSDNKIFFLSLYFRGPKGNTVTTGLQTNDGIANSLLTYQSLIQSFLDKINIKKEQHKEKSKGYFSTDQTSKDKYLILEDLSGKFELLGEAIELIETNLIFYSPYLQDKKFFDKGVQQITHKLGKLEENFEFIKSPLSKFEMNKKMLISLGINLDKIHSEADLKKLRTEIALTTEENAVLTEALEQRKEKDRLRRETNAVETNYYISMLLSPFKGFGDEIFKILKEWMISICIIFTPILLLACCIRRQITTFNLRRPAPLPALQPETNALPPSQENTIVMGDGNGNVALLTLQDNNLTIDGVIHQIKYNNSPNLTDIINELTLRKYVLSIDDNGILQCYKFLRLDKAKQLSRTKIVVEDEAGVQIKLSYDEIIDPILNSYDNFSKKCGESNNSPVVILQQLNPNASIESLEYSADLPPLLTASYASHTATLTGSPRVSPGVSNIGTPNGTPRVLLTGLSLVLPRGSPLRLSRESTPVLPRPRRSSNSSEERKKIKETANQISASLNRQLQSHKKTKKKKGN